MKQNLNYPLMIFVILLSLFVVFIPKIQNGFETTKLLPNTTSNMSTSSGHISYESKELKLSFILPPNSKVQEDKTFDWENEFKTKYALTKHLVINDTNSLRKYSFNLATIENDKPLAWEVNPSWYVPSLIKGDSNDEFRIKLKKYLQDPVYFKDAYIYNLNTFAKIVYLKTCYDSCYLERRYFIPFEKTIDGKIYHTLTFTTNIANLGDTNQMIENSLKNLKDQIKQDSYIDSEVNEAIKTQDMIVKSLKF